MSRKTIGIILIVVGVVVLIVSGFADALGIGGVPGFGWKQIVGSLVGLVIGVVGFWMTTRKTA